MFFLDEIGQHLVTAYIDGIDLQSLIDQYGALPLHIVLDEHGSMLATGAFA